MGRLRHQTFSGATYFVTTKTRQNISLFQVHEVAETLIGKMLEYRDKGSYQLHESVVMPNHLHLLITAGLSTSLAKAVQLVKGGSSHEIHRVRGTGAPIWPSGFHESTVRDHRDCKVKIDCIHFNPAVAKLPERPQDWPFGSASGKYQLDPIPQGLRPLGIQARDVGVEAPTNTSSLKEAC